MRPFVLSHAKEAPIFNGRLNEMFPPSIRRRMHLTVSLKWVFHVCDNMDGRLTYPPAWSSRTAQHLAIKDVYRKVPILRLPSTRENLFGFNAPGHCLVRACLLHCMRVRLRNGYTQAYAQIMQHTHTHKAVSGRVEAKKLLSRRRQSNYSIHNLSLKQLICSRQGLRFT